MAKHENKIAITWLEDGGSGHEAIDGLIEELCQKFNFHGVFWEYMDDLYYGVSQEPFTGEKLKEWAGEIMGKNPDFLDDDVTVEQIVAEAKKIKPRE